MGQKGSVWWGDIPESSAGAAGEVSRVIILEYQGLFNLLRFYLQLRDIPIAARSKPCCLDKGLFPAQCVLNPIKVTPNPVFSL